MKATVPETGPSRKVWIALFIAIALALLAGGYWYYSAETDRIRQARYEELAAIGQLKAGQIVQWRQERLADAWRIANSQLFGKALAEYLIDPQASGLRDDLLGRLKIEQAAYAYADVLLIDPAGKVLLSVKGAPDPPNPATRRAIAESLAANKPLFSDFYRCPRGVIHLDTVAPIIGDDGRPLAVVVLHNNASSYLYPLIMSWPTPSPSAETLLVRRDGNEILYLNDLRHRQDTALNLRIPLTRTDLPAVQAALGKEGIFEGLDYRGVETLGDLRPVPGTPWFLVAKVDKSEIMAEARYRAGGIAIVVLLGIMLVGVVAAYTYRQRQAGLYRDLYQAEQEKQQSQAALRESESKYRNTLDSMMEGCQIIGFDWRYLYLNNVAVLHGRRPREELLGRTQIECYPGIDQTEMFALEKRCMEERTIHNLENEFIYPDGSRSWFRLIIQPLPEGIAVYSEDITERKRAEASLKAALANVQRSNQELEQFAYVASHDLQEPLRMVASYTQLLAQRYEGQLDDKAKKYIHYAVDGAVRMQRLINDLLTYSRVSSRGAAPEPTDSHSVLGEALRNLQAAIEETGAMVTNDDLPTVPAAAGQLLQVFQNLVGNGIKFHGAESPHVHVSASGQGPEWIFSVRDNGIGIEPQYAGRIFEIFQRLHTKEEYPGTGIGLSVCRRIIERHGGRIWFESEFGKGATFFFTVPK